MGQPAIDIDALTTQERWDLIQRLWGGISQQAPELTDELRADLRAREAELDADVAAGRPLGSEWQDVRSRLFRKRDSS